MYPFVRLFKEGLIFRNASALEIGQDHVSYHICWPWDLDMWWELNNGRTLTIYDLGRIPLAIRGGLIGAMKKNGWGLTVAGSSVRYRRRVRAFAKIEMRSRIVTWDKRFIYIEQSMWRGDGECTSHALFRTAVTDKSGIVPPDRVAAAVGHTDPAPEMPGWIAAWIDAEAERPWPPEKH
ncbi:Thioesterase-like superfamily protein [Roseivivax halotolerans]|jgi:acyl-CoA thioesterase FadM|uniref:Thioesterase-like superfamily protein n=1 Tax=Roseivivax halotolerans TaxID=93684 RepID=A0A1I5V5N5_9RHOB|nr:acyl-CoA thioesterase [Roseivivax halotolerans]SFQ02798.1 Thioesterase-like superfamily protein [Roseivivax halotolerans]